MLLEIDSWFSLVVVGGTLITLVITTLIVYARWHYGTLEKLGIPVVKPHFLLGSNWETRFEQIGYRDVERVKVYGSVYGVYDGREPQIHICDPDLVRLIMVKDAAYFSEKVPIDFGDPLFKEMPDYCRGEKWKLVRNMTSPIFSSAKLRLMNFPMKEALIEFVNELKGKVENSNSKILENSPFDEVLFDALTDLTLRSLFSVKDKSDTFPKLLKEFANPPGMNYPNLKAVALSFPFLFNFIPPTLLSHAPPYQFLQVMENLIANRKKANSPPDVVDMCIEQIKKVDTDLYKRANVTKETILFQAFNLFFSGQDEAALVISAMIYHMLKSPPEMEIENKLYTEIDALWDVIKRNESDKSDENNFLFREKLVQAEYLQACINEALRMYTFYYTERECTKDWHCEKYNFTIPKGTPIMIPLWGLNRHPDYFEAPEEFNPERFLGESKEKMHGYAYTPFGHGQRICTGKPLALEVLRLTCFYLFKFFRFQLRENSRLEFYPDSPWTFILHEPVHFDISLRD